MPVDAHVLVLGGGISGCLVAAGLSDRGLKVAIVEQQPQLMAGASRWNDGKIHLGYTFTGMPSLATARLMQKGSAAFIGGLERVLGEQIPAAWSSAGVIYLVDSRSMVDAETLWQRAQQVRHLHDEMSTSDSGMRHYLDGQPDLERLTVTDASELTRQGGIVAAWRTPERHVSTREVADRLAEATLARGVGIIQGEVIRADAESDGWRVSLGDGGTAWAPVVVNCLWENRTVIDRHIGGSVEPTSIRYKRALFGSAVGSLDGVSPSTRILGPYGDIVTYAGGDAYLSWYPAGLVARSDDGVPPSVPEPDLAVETGAIIDGLRLPTAVLSDPAAVWQLEGGFVVAWGYGDIHQPGSPLHERHRPGVWEVGPDFFSVDTGKYTLAPLMAERAVERVLLSSDVAALAASDR